MHYLLIINAKKSKTFNNKYDARHKQSQSFPFTADALL